MTAEFSRFLCALCGQCQFCMRDWERRCADSDDHEHVWNHPEPHAHVTPESLAHAKAQLAEARAVIAAGKNRHQEKMG